MDPIDAWIDELEREREHFRRERIKATWQALAVLVVGSAVLAIVWLNS